MRRNPGTRFRVFAGGLAAAVLGLLAGGLGCGRPTESETSHPVQPTIVLISLDTLRADHLGTYGHHRQTSPVLDSFAADGTVFEDANSTAPWTLPAHASMLTGLYPLNHRVLTFDTALPQDMPNLASNLSKAGYRTAAIVNSAWLKKERYGLTRDFDEYLFVDDTQDRRGPNTWITDQAISWLTDDDERPLFLFLHYYDIHSDYTSLPQFERLFLTPYDGEADGTAWQIARASLEKDYLEMCKKNYDPEKCRIGTPEKHLIIDRTLKTLSFDEDDIRHIEELYDAGIRQLDNELGRLFSTLEHQGLLDSSLIIITSDHGEEFQEHGRMDHFLTMHKEILHVPLIFHGPSVPAGLRVKTPVSLVDLAPTILSMAGEEPEFNTDGFDLSPLFRGESPPHFIERPIFGEASGGLTYALMMDNVFPIFRSLRVGQYKLIHNSKEERWSLYDLDKDPYETVDLAQDTPEIVERMRGQMKQRYEGFDPAPDPSVRVQLGTDELEHLRSLGYLP